MTKNTETHNVCNARIAKDDGKALCCDCVPHEGCEFEDEPHQSRKWPDWQKEFDKNFGHVHWGSGMDEVDMTDSIKDFIEKLLAQREEESQTRER